MSEQLLLAPPKPTPWVLTYANGTTEMVQACTVREAVDNRSYVAMPQTVSSPHLIAQMSQRPGKRRTPLLDRINPKWDRYDEDWDSGE